jgi:hypothetical protein
MNTYKQLQAVGIELNEEVGFVLEARQTPMARIIFEFDNRFMHIKK